MVFLSVKARGFAKRLLSLIYGDAKLRTGAPRVRSGR